MLRVLPRTIISSRYNTQCLFSHDHSWEKGNHCYLPPSLTQPLFSLFLSSSHEPLPPFLSGSVEKVLICTTVKSSNFMSTQPPFLQPPFLFTAAVLVWVVGGRWTLWHRHERVVKLWGEEIHYNIDWYVECWLVLSVHSYLGEHQLLRVRWQLCEQS